MELHSNWSPWLSIVIMFKQRQPASSKNGSLVITVEGSQSERNIPESNVTSWTKLVLDMYPPGTSVRYARALQICVLDVLINDSYECWVHAGIPSFGLLICYVTRWLAGFSVLLPLRWWLDCYPFDQRQSLFVLDCCWLALVYCYLLDDDWIVIHLTKDSHCLFLTAVAVR